MKFIEGDYIIGTSNWDTDIYKVICDEQQSASEYHSRYTISNGEKTIKGSYLHNGCWRKLTKEELRVYKLERICKKN